MITIMLLILLLHDITADAHAKVWPEHGTTADNFIHLHTKHVHTLEQPPDPPSLLALGGQQHWGLWRSCAFLLLGVLASMASCNICRVFFCCVRSILCISLCAFTSRFIFVSRAFVIGVPSLRSCSFPFFHA
jgi:hypothetical protein